MMAAEHYLDLFAGRDTTEARAAALRLSSAIEWYIARCEAEAKRAREQ